MVESVAEGLDHVAKALSLEDVDDVFKASSYIRAVSKLSRWHRAALAYGSVERLLAKDRALIKQFLSSFQAFQNWDVAGLQASILYDLEGLTHNAEKYLQHVVASDLKVLKGQLTTKVKELEPLLEKQKWKTGVADSASLKDVLDKAKAVLLQEGVGILLQKAQKDMTKARSRMLVLCASKTSLVTHELKLDSFGRTRL